MNEPVPEPKEYEYTANAERYRAERNKLEQALIAAGITEVEFSQFVIPKALPAAIVVIESEKGKNPSRNRYNASDLNWSVYIIVNAKNDNDPDLALFEKKELFRQETIETMGMDWETTDYYPSRVETREVRIAHLTTRSGA